MLLIINFNPATGSTLHTKINYQTNISTDDIDIYEIMSNITENKLKKHVQEIQNFGPHPTGSEELISVQNYLYNILNKTGLTVKLKPWDLEGKTGNNIEATLQGKGKTNSIVIICAHYDSVEISPGADDDGSGVTSVVNIAEALSNYTFNSTIKFVLFSGEEQGLFGSRAYAKETYENKDNINTIINLDGVGYASNQKNGGTIRALIRDDDQWILNIANNITKEFQELLNLNIYRYPKVINGDHKPFVDHGYDGIYFLENEINPYYHTSDDKTQHMNFTYLQKICRLALGTLIKIANLERDIKKEDLKISIKGMLLSKPAQLSISIKNNYYPQDTANLSINISLINIITGKYIHGMYNTVTYWETKEEIKEKWELKIGSRYYKPEPFICKVTIKGYNDDVYIYKEVKTYGLTFKTFLFVIPFIEYK